MHETYRGRVWCLEFKSETRKMSVAIFTSALDKTQASEWPFTLFLTFFSPLQLCLLHFGNIGKKVNCHHFQHSFLGNWTGWTCGSLAFQFPFHCDTQKLQIPGNSDTPARLCSLDFNFTVILRNSVLDELQYFNHQNLPLSQKPVEVPKSLYVLET